MDKKYSLPATKTIEGVEIFAAGTWNGDTYTVEDLDEMARSFEDTKEAMKPYLKLGHTNKQKIAQADGLPAVGWIDKIRRVGTKLVADFVNVPKAIYDLIERRAYSRVSSEIYFNIDVMGRKFGKLLKAVALLGGDTPAVQNLKDIMALYSIGDENEMKAFMPTVGGTACYGDEAESVAYSLNAESLKGDKEEIDMNELEQFKAKVAELEKNLSEATSRLKEFECKGDGMEEMKKKMKALEEENGKLKGELDKFKCKNNELEAIAAEYKDKAAAEEVTAKVDKLIADKKITPAQKEHAFTLLMEAKKDVSEKKYKLGEKEVSKEDFVLAFFSSNSVEVKTDPVTGKGEAHLSDEDKKIREYSEKNKVSYKEAMLALSAEEK